MSGKTARSNAATVERMHCLYERGDLESVERAALDYWTEDTRDEFPQSGEHFRGREAAAALLDATAAAYGGWPTLTLRELRGRDDPRVIEGTIEYGDGSHVCAVTIFELHDGLIARQTDYFASPFDAPDWRAPFREPTARGKA